MIIYFCDRQLNILGQASTNLPAGNRISQDKLVEDVETGVNTFECYISYDKATRRSVESALVTGNYILKKSETSYDALFQIVEAEGDSKAKEIYIYAEDAGLELINTLCPAATLQNMNVAQMLDYFLPNDWDINTHDAPLTTKTYTWDGESTCTERVRSVVGLWGCELYYSFDIEGLSLKGKSINVVQKRGLQVAIPQLRLNYDIDRIRTQSSIENLVTALNVTGGKPEGSETPINLVNYDYTWQDPYTGDIYQVDKPTGQMRNLTAMDRWSSPIDTDGLWVGSYSFDTIDKAILAGQARAELQRLSAPTVNYEVDFTALPEDAKIGDRVNIIDDEGELYLEARLLLIETCEADNTKKATLGEYLIRSSGISAKVQALAEEIANLGDLKTTYTWVAYANDKTGSGISLNPAGKTYIGIAVNKDTATVDISDPSVFSWVQMDSDSIVALSCEITSSEGTLFILTTVDTVLTAHIYANGIELNTSQIADIGTIRWYNADNLTTVLGTGQTYTITQAMDISAINIIARLEVEV